MGNAIATDPRRTEELNPEQFAHLQEDQETWGNEQNGIYRGISHYAWRHPRMKHWCGYINPNTEISEDMYEKLDDVAHGGITGDRGGPGFDCSHHGDFPLTIDGVYRNYPYVLNNMKAMIDVLLDE